MESAHDVLQEALERHEGGFELGTFVQVEINESMGKFDGYDLPLSECPGYMPEDEELHRTLTAQDRNG